MFMDERFDLETHGLHTSYYSLEYEAPIKVINFKIQAVKESLRTLGL
jgi:hypothetical protein